MTLEEAAAKFRFFADREAKDSSPIYSELAQRVAGDETVLQVAARAPASQPLANLLFASVQYLLMPAGQAISVEDSPEQAFERLRSTVVQRQSEIEFLLTTRLVQTNEVRRSIIVYCAVQRALREIPSGPVSLIEIGASAGLNLLIDQYSYQFGNGSYFDRHDSPIHLRSELRGNLHPPTSALDREVAERVGIDLNPVRVDQESEINWLRSLIWPEHSDRRALLEDALHFRRGFSIRMVQGDGVRLLEPIIEGCPASTVPVVFHTYVANQMSPESKLELVTAVDRIGSVRNIVHIHNHIEDGLHCTVYRGGTRFDIRLANIDPHARWVEWLDG